MTRMSAASQKRSSYSSESMARRRTRVLAEARNSEAFDDATLREVETFLTNPRAWQAARS